MSPAPGALSELVDEAGRPIDLTDTATLHLTALASAGPVDQPVPIQTKSRLREVFGPEVGWSSLHRVLDAALPESLDDSGATMTAWVQRYDGAGALPSTLTLPTSTSGRNVVVEDASPGVANAKVIDVISAQAGAARVVVVKLAATGEIIDQSPALASNADIAAYFRGDVNGKPTKWGIRWKPDAGAPLPNAETGGALTGGVEDRQNAGDLQRQNALTLLDTLDTTGQLLSVDATSDQAHYDLLVAAARKRRFALLDATPGSSKGQLIAAAQAAAATGADVRRSGMLLGDPLIVDSTGVPVEVQASAPVAGLLALTDHRYGPQVAAAASRGVFRNVLGLTREWTNEQDRADLNDAGVNIARTIRGLIQLYGYRTLSTENAWVGAAGARTIMAFRADAQPILDDYVEVSITESNRRGLQERLTLLAQAYTDRDAFDKTHPEGPFTINVGTVRSPATEARFVPTGTVATPRTAERAVFQIAAQED